MFIKETSTCQSSIADIASADPALPPLVSALWRYAGDKDFNAVADVIPADVLPGLAGNFHAFLLVLLPAAAEDKVRGMLDGEAEVLNDISDDLLNSVTVLSLGNSDAKLHLASALLPSAISYSEESFVVVVVSGDTVFRKQFVPTNWEYFLCELQATEAGSGSNYEPHRIYTDEELRAAALEAEKAPMSDSKVFAPVPLCFGN